jgi:hypothetical protein
MVAHILAPRLKRLHRDTPRLAEKLSAKKSRLRKQTDHCLSKETAATAERSPQRDCDLKIRRISAQGLRPEKAQRSRLHGPLLNFAVRESPKSMPIVAVDPCNTGRTCPECASIH